MANIDSIWDFKKILSQLSTCEEPVSPISDSELSTAVSNLSTCEFIVLSKACLENSSRILQVIESEGFHDECVELREMFEKIWKEVEELEQESYDSDYSSQESESEEQVIDDGSAGLHDEGGC